MKVRNPWGSESYKGDFSDKSKAWTDDLRKQAGNVVKDDGEFFIPLEDFMTSFSETSLNLDRKSVV